MTLKGRTSRTILYTAFLALDITLFTQLTAFFLLGGGMAGIARGRQVHPAPITVPVANNQSNIVQSVYVNGTLDLQVVQQPKGEANYVSPKDGELTQFSTVSQYGNIGLLAHNYLSGRAFSQLAIGQDVHVMYSNGEIESFVITEILSYQALEPKSQYSSFQSLENEGEILTVEEMFDRVYRGDRHLTFQTCIANDGMTSWGRLFVVARPKHGVASFESRNLMSAVSYAYP